MDVTEGLKSARAAFAAQDWARAFETYAALSTAAPLELLDLEHYAAAVQMLGRKDESRKLLATGYQQAIANSNFAAAVRFAFWNFQSFAFTGDSTRAAAWLARGRAALEHCEQDCVERGYML